jgi:conserved oligomeric Golgi complex subunit 6
VKNGPFSASTYTPYHLTSPPSQGVETRKSIITLFLSRFTLSEAEAAALTSRDVPVGCRFFDAMDRVERIRRDCRVLMAGEDGPTQAG